jgi:hypothetical protein
VRLDRGDIGGDERGHVTVARCSRNVVVACQSRSNGSAGPGTGRPGREDAESRRRRVEVAPGDREGPNHRAVRRRNRVGLLLPADAPGLGEDERAHGVLLRVGVGER